jgi:hypothetical protein
VLRQDKQWASRSEHALETGVLWQPTGLVVLGMTEVDRFCAFHTSFVHLGLCSAEQQVMAEPKAPAHKKAKKVVHPPPGFESSDPQPPVDDLSQAAEPAPWDASCALEVAGRYLTEDVLLAAWDRMFPDSTSSGRQEAVEKSADQWSQEWISFVQYICAFVRDDLEEEGSRLDEEQWIDIVHELKSRAGAWFDARSREPRAVELD